MRLSAAAALAVVGLITVSCGGIIDPSKNAVDTFSDSLSVNRSAVAHAFSASKSGEISVKITALAPLSNTFIGVTWAQAGSDGGCTTSIGGVFQQNPVGQLNIPAISGPIQQGRYCLIMQDVIGFTTPETYTVTVSHP